MKREPGVVILQRSVLEWTARIIGPASAAAKALAWADGKSVECAFACRGTDIIAFTLTDSEDSDG